MAPPGPLARRSPSTDRQALLNWDILAEVMSFVPRADASRMARTCRTLLQVAPRYLLAGTVTLPSGRQCRSFCKFMLRPDRKDSFRYLRRLSISLAFNVIGQCGMSFGTVFAQATELEWLDLGRGSVLDEDDRISDAVAAMTKLRVLLIQSPTPTTLKTLKDMQAPLTAVDADFFGYNGRCRDPVVVFSPFKESLETMKVASVHFSKPDVRYHRVTSLTAQDCHNVHLLNMVRCFPNLQDLHLEVGQGAVSSEWFIDSQRSQNLEARAQVVWQSLTRLSGNLVCLYTLALCHSVDHLCVASSMLTPADEERLSAVLRDLRGLHSLYLKLKAPDFDTATLDRALAPVKATLAELMLRLEYRGRNYREVPAYTNAMIESLSAFPLHTLRLCIKWYYNGPKGDPMFDSNFNHLSIAEHAMRCIASLRYIYVEIEPTATEFDIESKVEGDGRLVRFLQPLEEQWSLADPDALFSNDFLESWWQVTGS